MAADRTHTYLMNEEIELARKEFAQRAHDLAEAVDDIRGARAVEIENAVERAYFPLLNFRKAQIELLRLEEHYHVPPIM